MARGQRIVAIDISRGLAIAGVVLFHIVWDLEFTGLISGVARHPIWLAFGRTLASTFMFLVGVSLVLAHSRTIYIRAFARRLLTIIAYAAVISVVTWFVFPESFIYFGILHAIAAATLLGALFLRAHVLVCLAAAMLIIVLSFIVYDPAFNTRWLAWTGFSQHPPPSNDFVPIFPWVGITLLGMVAAKLFPFRKVGISATMTRPRSRFARVLVWMGNRSLPIYLLHQPILLSVIVPLSWVLSTER